MKKRIVIPALCILGSVLATGAAYIRGSVVAENGEEMPGVVVSLIALPDSTVAAGTMTDEHGKYEFADVDSGSYRLKFEMVGTRPASMPVEVASAADSLEVAPATLGENSAMLDEVVVKGIKTAVIAKEDTLEYNAGSYHTRQNATVEDLLKRLPGVEVAADGSITSGGKSITKILVDGKEFFGDDPKAATKNLPSDMIDKVQVVNRKSDLARITGVDDGEEETVINLSVKKDMKNGWFGNVSAGYGTDSRYAYSFNVNRFQNGNQITLLGGGNNINEMGFTDRGRGRFGGFGGNNGINSTQHLGLNFNVGNGEKFRVGGNVIYSHSDRKTLQTQQTQYLFPDSTSYLDSYNSSRDKGHNINADFRLQWKIDEANTLDFRPRFTWSGRDQEKNDTSLLRAGDKWLSKVNASQNDRRIHGDSYEISGNLIFNHNVLSHPGRSFSAQMQYSFSDSRQKEYSWSRILYYLLHDEDEELYRYLDTRNRSSLISGRLTWTEPIGNAANGNFIETAYGINYSFNNADKLTYSLPAESYPGFIPEPDGTPDGAVSDPSLSNRFRNRFFSQELRIGYKKVSRKFNLNVGLQFSPASSSSHDLIDDSRDIPTRWVWNVAPFMRLRWKISDSSSLRANYRARTSQPSMQQLQPVADTSDPLHITVGNPDLKPSFSQNLSLHFSDFNTDAQRSLFAMINAGYTSNKVASRTVTDNKTGVRTTSYTNVNGDWQLMAMGMLTQPLRNRAWRINAQLRGNYSSSVGFVNGDRNRAGNLSVNPSAAITFTSDIFQMSIGPSYGLQLATASLPSQPRRTVHSYGFTSDASLYLPFGLEISTDLAMSKNSGYSAGFDNSQWLWNAQISYSMLRDKSLSISLRVYDILQEKKNITRSVSASSIIDSRINDLTRYAMLTLTWKFNSFGSSKDIPAIDGDRGPRPGGPGEGGRERPNHGAGGPPMGPPPGR